MEEAKKVIKSLLSKFGYVLVMLFIIIIFIGSVIVAFVKSGISASAFSGDYYDYVNLGDYIIKVDEEGAMPALTKEQLKTAINKCYSGQARNNCLSVLDDLISVQSKYKVNAAFMVAVAQKESTCGTGWQAIDPNSHNWFSILYGSKWNGASGKTCTGGVGTWCWYDSFNEAVQKYGIYMTEHDYFYFSHGEYTVAQIAPHFAGDEWERGVKGYLDELYSAVAETMSPGEGTYRGETYSYSGKKYTLFTQRGNYHAFGYNQNGQRTIDTSGCGATSIAICVSGYLKGQDPSSITDKCAKYGYTCDSNAVFSQWLGEYGLKGSFYSWGSDAVDKIVNHIKSGKPVIYNIGGTMKLDSGATNSYSLGHFLTLLGVNERGHIFVGDPYGEDGYTSIENIKNAGPKAYLLVDKK